jgi:hypothetical protein
MEMPSFTKSIIVSSAAFFICARYNLFFYTFQQVNINPNRATHLNSIGKKLLSAHILYLKPLPFIRQIFSQG